MAGQGATSLQGISSYGRRNQSLYATEMHLSLTWTSLLWFHGVWYGPPLSVFILCHSSSAETDERCNALKGFVSIQRVNSTRAGWFLDSDCFVFARLRAYFCTRVYILASIYVNMHAYPYASVTAASSIHEHLVWSHDANTELFISALWGSICINHNAEQMDDTAVALRCPPSSLLVFETAIWAYVPIMSSSDNNQINSSLISALFALIFSNIYRHQSDIYCIYYTWSFFLVSLLWKRRGSSPPKTLCSHTLEMCAS